MADLLTTEEAAKQLGVTAGTLQIWRCTRRYPLKFVKIGRKVRYRPADLEDFLQARTHSGVGETSTRRAGRSKAA